MGGGLRLPVPPAALSEVERIVTSFRELRPGQTPDGKTALKSSSGSLSTVEAIAVMVGGSRRRPGSWMARSLPRRWR